MKKHVQVERALDQILNDIDFPVTGNVYFFLDVCLVQKLGETLERIMYLFLFE